MFLSFSFSAAFGVSFLFFSLFGCAGFRVLERELVACWVGFRASFAGWDLGIQGVFVWFVLFGCCC